MPIVAPETMIVEPHGMPLAARRARRILRDMPVERKIALLVVVFCTIAAGMLGVLALIIHATLNAASMEAMPEGGAFGRVFFPFAAVLLLLTGTAFALPALAWYRGSKEKEIAELRHDELAEDARAQQRRLEGMLANTPHGLCMFDADKCLVLSNQRYADLYNLPPHVVRSGATLQSIIDYRTAIGNAPLNFPNYVTHDGVQWKMGGNSVFEVALADGRTVRLNHLALRGGGYVATHEDITEFAREASRARAARELAEARAALVAELEQKNKELETFSYSVSHDLRAPLRAIDGFSHAIAEDCGSQLDAIGQGHLKRIREAAQRMGELIDDILQLSRVTRAEMIVGRVDLSSLAHEVAEDLQRRNNGHAVEFKADEGLVVEADRRMMKIVLENLIGNAWKFTRRTDRPVIEFGVALNGEPSFFVRDNGAGFDMAQATKLFQPFQRLHSDADFPGTGIGLATIYRVIERHGGRVWAEGKVGEGASIFFTLPDMGAHLLRQTAGRA